MHIETVQIKNIRCFEDVTLDLQSPQGPKKLAVVVGDNGAGKTTLLRAIAMGLCDKDSTSALLRDTTGDLIREGANSATIRIRLREGNKLRSITTTFAKSGSGFEIVKEQETQPRKSFPWGSIFVCGYGANRGTEGASDTERYSAADAVYTLFSYDWPLLNPEVVLWRRTEGNKDRTKKICRAMDQILMLPNGSTRLSRKGLRVSDSRRFVAGVGAMADGYAGTLTWVLDMLGWWYVAHPRAVRLPEGIVLIDELEQHLHPSWQRAIVKLLRERFKGLQFICTTHSSLCAAGLGDLSDREASLVVLSRGKGKAVSAARLPLMRGWRYDEVLTSGAFGVPEWRNIKAAEQLTELNSLYVLKKPSPAQKNRIEKLERDLAREAPTTREESRQMKMQAEITKTLRRLQKGLKKRKTQR